MPRHADEIPRYCRHKATGQAVVRIDGRDHYLGRHGTAASRAAYDRLIAEWLAAGRRLAAPSGATVTELCLAYWRWAKRRYRKAGRPTSQLCEIRSAVRPLRRLYGRTPTAKFTGLSLLAYRRQVAAGGLCRRTVNGRVRIVQQVFRWGVPRQLVPEAVHRELATLEPYHAGDPDAPPDRPPVRPADIEHVLAVEPFVTRPVWAMIELQLLTGMRPGEVVLLRPCDIERPAAGVWIYRPASHKTAHHGHERVVELGPTAQRMLEPFLDRPADAYCFSPLEAVIEHNAAVRARRRTPLWPSHSSEARRLRRGRQRPAHRAGRRYRPDSYRRAIVRACARAGVPRWTPHRLRHTAGTEIRRRYGVEAARIVLGHRSIDVTQIYAEADRRQARRIAAEMG